LVFTVVKETASADMLSVRTVLPKSKYSKTSVAFWQKSGLAQSAMLSTERSVRLQQPVVVALGQLSVWATCPCHCFMLYAQLRLCYLPVKCQLCCTCIGLQRTDSMSARAG